MVIWGIIPFQTLLKQFKEMPEGVAHEDWIRTIVAISVQIGKTHAKEMELLKDLQRLEYNNRVQVHGSRFSTHSDGRGWP